MALSLTLLGERNFYDNNGSGNISVNATGYTGLILGLCTDDNDNGWTATATFNGDAMAQEAEINESTGNNVIVFSLANPDQTTANVAITCTGTWNQGIAYVYGVTDGSTTDVCGTCATANSANPYTSTSATVTSETGGIVVDFWATSDATADPTAGGGQSEVDDSGNVIGSCRAATSTKAGAASVTMSWTHAAANASIIAVPVNPGAALTKKPKFLAHSRRRNAA